MTLSEQSPSRSVSYKRPVTTPTIPTLHNIEIQVPSIDSLLQGYHITIDQMQQHIQQLENRMSILESRRNTTVDIIHSSAIQKSGHTMHDSRRRRIAFLPKLASHFTKFYLLAILGLGIALWVSTIFSVTIDNTLIESIKDLFLRAGLLLFLFFGIVAVQQSVH